MCIKIMHAHEEMLLIVTTKAITSSKFRNIGYFNSDLLFKEISEFCIKPQYYPNYSVLMFIFF